MQLRNKLRLGDILLKEQVITQEQLEKALAVQKENRKKLGETLLDLGFLTEDEIARTLARQLKLEMVTLRGITIDEAIVHLVDGTVLRKYAMVPFEYSKENLNVVRLAMADPMDMRALDDFTIITDLQAEVVVATQGDIMLTIDRYYGDSETIVAAQAYARERELMDESRDNELVNEDINNSPIVLLVRSMIEQAARQRASDIHVEAMEDRVRVRYRIDGALYEKFSYDKRLLEGIIARIKVVSGLDISEKRKPQDGSISMMIDRSDYDIRISILPTVHGEKCVMRLKKKKELMRNKKELGLSKDEIQSFDGILKNANGILLVTGPTGSGKSTTLYTALSELNREEVNIVTVEDPVEADLDGINQIQMNEKTGLTFANALRSILRQDPDIIMIGEIRDRETAEIAVQASLTGHLVVSTIHTNSAASTITRLVDIGIDNYLIADSMIGVIAQRLLRRLCSHCRKEREATEEEKKYLDMESEDDVRVYEPMGCSLCNNTGYYGRIGVFEIMTMTPAIRRIIAAGGITEEIMEQALSEGMHTIRSNAIRYVLDGTTSIQEAIRITFEN